MAQFRQLAACLSSDTDFASVYNKPKKRIKCIFSPVLGILYQKQVNIHQNKNKPTESVIWNNSIINMGKQCSVWLKDKSEEEQKQKNGLLICGSVGSGKTTMAKAVIEYLWHFTINSNTNMPNERDKEDSPYTFGWIHTAEGYASKTKEERDAIDNKAIVFLDDIGTEPARVLQYGTEYYPFKTFIENRYDREGRMPQLTILTSNYSIKQLGEIYGERTADRMREMFDVVSINDISKRK